MGAVSNAVASIDPTTEEGLKNTLNISTLGSSGVVDRAFSEGGVIDQNLLGGAERDAAEKAAAEQERAGQEAMSIQERTSAQIRGDLAPFREGGAAALPLLSGAINDPSSRVLNNPFFQTMAADQEQRLLASAAARGKVGSGGTGDDLQRNLLLLGNQFAQQDITNLQNLTNTGSNAAAQTGSFLQQGATAQGGILGNIANANAAATVAGANAEADARNSLITAGATIFCDIRLKDNVKFSHVENGIRMYNWSWTDEALDVVGNQSTTGPIAQELKKSHPELVTMDEETGFYKVLM
jgi:hypothetical protein